MYIYQYNQRYSATVFKYGNSNDVIIIKILIAKIILNKNSDDVIAVRYKNPNTCERKMKNRLIRKMLDFKGNNEGNNFREQYFYLKKYYYKGPENIPSQASLKLKKISY